MNKVSSHKKSILTTYHACQFHECIEVNDGSLSLNFSFTTAVKPAIIQANAADCHNTWRIIPAVWSGIMFHELIAKTCPTKNSPTIRTGCHANILDSQLMS